MAVGRVFLWLRWCDCLCDVSTGSPRPIVPTNWRRRIIDLIHRLSHPSIRTTQKLVTSKFVWNGVQKQVGAWAKQCTACQSSKIQTHIRTPLEKIKIPQRRFDHIHVDLVGPLHHPKGLPICSLLSTVFPVGLRPFR